jgi:AsmA family protein
MPAMDESRTSATRPRWRALQIATGIIVVLIAGVVIGERHLKGALEHLIATRTGRQVHIGELQTNLLSLHPSLRAREVSLGNPSWSPPGTMAEVAGVGLLLEWHWAWPPLQIHRLELEGASLHLVRDEQDHANWRMHDGGPGKGPPLIHSLSMTNARVELHDARRHLEFTGTVSAADSIPDSAPAALRIEGSGRLNGRTASFVLLGDPLAGVQRDQPYHFKLDERSGTARLQGRGYLDHPFDFRQLQGSFELRGSDMGDVYYLVGLKLPQTAAFTFYGKLARDGTRFVYTDLRAASGESDLEGSVNVDRPHGRSRIEAKLTSRRLRLADVGARAAAGAAAPNDPVDTAKSPPAQKLLKIPDTPLKVAGLQKSDAVVTFHARQVEAGHIDLDDVSGKLSIDKGVLTVSAIQAKVAGGELSGGAQLDASHAVPRGSLDVVISGAQLEQLRGGHAAMSGLSGPLSLRAQLKGTGTSYHEMATTADGTLTAVVPRGTMRAALAEAASLELAGALGLLTKSQKETGVRCAVASFGAHEGVLTARSIVIDTDKALITASGDAQLDSEALNFTLRGHPKSPTLALHSSVAVRGTLAHPQFRLSGDKAAAQTGVAAALGVVLTPLAAGLAFVNPGLAHNADCEALIADLQQSGLAPAGVAAAAK